MADINAIFAGFGGQGVLFVGKVFTYTGFVEEKHVSWLPSYGPEMRGGTANCSVCVSENPIASPLVVTPNVLIAMNIPSYDKFIDTVEPGGIVVVDSTLVDRKCERDDIEVYYVPATKLAEDNGLQSLANIILMGKLLGVSKFAELESVKKAIEKSVPASKTHLVEKNIEAIELGMKS